MKRLENFRKGDRAEKLGVVLLQAFCAVAEVPRQEDFGLMDAVATLLRREGRFWYAEDSFLVQMKSRTVKRIEYSGAQLDALVNQDLPILVARVDLTRSSLELHTLGIALAHPNFNDAKSLIVHLHPEESCPFGLIDNVFHAPLHKPILQWTTRQTEDVAFTGDAYKVLKEWMTIERWNRRYRQAGMTRQIRWETNAVPTDGGESYMWNPTRTTEALGEIVPFACLLAFHATRHAELRAPTRAIFSWLRQSGIEGDPDGMVRLFLQMEDSKDRLENALQRNPGADVAVTFCVDEVRPDFLAFWLFSRDRQGTGGGNRYAGSLQAIHEKGLEAKIEIFGEKACVTIGLSDAWLRKHRLVEATPKAVVDSPNPEQGATQIILLRKAALPDVCDLGCS